MGADGIAARGLAPEGHARGIAAKAGNVVMHPAQRRLLIHQSEVAGILSDRGMREKAQSAEPVVETDPDDPGLLDDFRHVRLVRAAVDEPSAVDEHIDRQPRVLGGL